MWDGWPLDRAVHIVTAVGLIGIGAQAYLFHSRQNFTQWVQWIPVIGAPAIGLLEFIYGSYQLQTLEIFSIIMLWVGVAAGLFGTYRHVVGVGHRVGGYQASNFLVGPPAIVPFLIVVLSAFGLVAHYLGGRG